MKRSMSMLAISLLLIASLGTGCIGNFGLAGEVRKFNLEVSKDRWGREIVFVCLYIIPVYPIAGALDMIIFNSIEFWTGKNPINGSASVTPIAMREWTNDDGSKVAMVPQPDESIDVTLTSVDGEEQYFNLVRTDEGVAARDADGNIIISAADLMTEGMNGPS
jgi:hypothetical protein